MDTGEIISSYIKWRDEKKEVEERHKQELAPIKEKMEKAEAALQKTMLEGGLKQLKSEAGTAYITEQVSPKITNWEETINWIKENERYDVLERRINKNAVKEEEIPGVEKTTRLKTNVRIS